MNRLTFLPIVIAFATSIACGSTSSSTSVGPTPARCAVSAASNPSTFPHGGGSGNLVVSAERECSWAASSQSAWITLGAPTQGQGDGTVQYTVAPNPQGATRQGTLVVGGQSTTVSQQPAPCRFEIDRRTFELPASEATAEVNVQAPGGCTWSASSSASWITIVDGTQGNGNGRVQFRAAANAGTTARTGSLQVAGERVDVRQLPAGAAPPPPPPPAPGDCSFEVVPDLAEAGPEASSGSIAVQTESGCSWSAASDSAWLTVAAGATGSGPGQVEYQAAANTSSSGRTGRITIGNATFTLQQAGEAACTYRIDPDSASVGYKLTNGRIDVSTGNLCVWTAVSTKSWIEITSGESGIGDGEVRYRVRQNPLAEVRIGTIIVGGQEFTVTQKAAPSNDGDD